MKKIIFILFLFATIVFTGCSNTINIDDWSIIISSWYIAQAYYNNHLDLKKQDFSKIPDLCSDTTWNMIYDVWSIDLSNNNLEDINLDLSCFPNLKELNMSYNNIDSIENLDNLTTLTKLKLHKNKISKIKWLDKLTKLQELNLWYNNITKVENLESLKSLTILELQHNQIETIQDLEALDNLNTVKLEYNNISDESQLDWVKRVETVTSGGNPFSK